ncbi:DUF4249 domain-containing protein [Massilibacteroides sp.]|uniref:DUF4249 domain-containing protein n=1 Tax=Massilibacteroides sp. TaxID=2034766 RepID=UPI002602C9DD|nr:DUF4249 domain-containing protein [Massilibacteroides sp.]MDD4515595.1 DUF4249 domain-containing protein [Massilibacteroides sp.]
MRKAYIYLLTFFTLLTTACTERIELDLDSDDSKIVIYGTITDTLAYQNISISSSLPYFDQGHNPTISGAQVSIKTSDNEVWTLLESDTEKGRYQTQDLKAGKPGESYHLTVEYDFDQDGLSELYEASTTMSRKFVIDSVEIRTMNDMGFNVFTVNMFAQEPEGEDFYISKYYVCDTLATKLSKFGLMKDLLTDGEYLNGFLVYYFSDKAEIDDYAEDDLKYQTFISSGDEVVVEYCRVEKGYFNFIEQAQDMKYGENPMFGGPPSNIQGNISNGGVGYFTAYSPSQKRAIAP